MFPSNANRSFVALAEASWAPKEEDRPSFESILNTLMQLRKELGGQTPRVNLKGSLGAMPKANDIKMDSVAGGTVNEAEPLFEYTGGVAAAAPPPPPSSISGVQAGVHKLMGMGHGRDKLEPVTEERGSESMMASMKGLAVVIDAASEAR